jgi:hypothetical protein
MKVTGRRTTQRLGDRLYKRFNPVLSDFSMQLASDQIGAATKMSKVLTPPRTSVQEE